MLDRPYNHRASNNSAKKAREAGVKAFGNDWKICPEGKQDFGARKLRRIVSEEKNLDGGMIKKED